MKLPFFKMEGSGNDYVYLDGVRHPFEIRWGPALARRLADRHYGIGGDGLIVMLVGERAPCRMVMWNADGSRGAMCGNGLRCVAKLAWDTELVRTPRFEVETDAGRRPVELVFEGGEVVGARVDMGAVAVAGADEEIAAAGRSWRFRRADAGNPHAVIPVDADPEGLPLEEIGRACNADARFAGGVNVELAWHTGSDPGDVVHQRTWERGSGETLACGSGAVAVAAVLWELGIATAPRVPVRLRGGTVIVERGSSLVMEGPARTVFTGEVVVDPD